MAETRTHYAVTFSVLAVAALAFSLLQSLVPRPFLHSRRRCTPRRPAPAGCSPPIS